MLIKQLSIFLENREGRLEKVTETMMQHNINIISLSLADTSEYGMLRMLVSNPYEAKKVLKEEGFSAMLTDVVAVKIPHKFGMLHQVLKTLVSQGISVEYMYALATGEDAAIIMKLSDAQAAITTLLANNFEIYKAEDVYKINELI